MRLAILCALLLGVLSCTHWAAAAETTEVRFVIGGLMPEEGGDWKQTDSPLNNPFGIDFDSKGHMYIVELGGGRVHRLDTMGNLTRIAGDGSEAYGGDGGPAADATFNGMHNCAVTGDDQLLIADSWNHCVRRVNLDSGVIETIVGTGKAGFDGDGGRAIDASFNFVMCISLSPDKRTLHVTDLKNRRIRNVDLRSQLVTTVAGNGAKGIPSDGSPATDGPLVDPRAAASDAAGNLYVLERSGNALRVVRADGSIHTIAGSGQKGYRDGPALQAQFGSPKHVCTDPEGNVYIADDLNGAIRKYDPRTLQVTTVLGRGVGHADVRLLHPHGVCFHDGVLYVIDSGNSRILSVRGSEL